MDRKKLEARLEGSAVKAEIITIPLSSGDKVGLRRATNDEMIRSMAAAGDDLDQQARMFTSLLRFCIVDDDGEPLLRSFDESAAFINTLDLEDFVALRDAVQDIQPDLGDTEVVEAGKGS
jgi:hypothetical protein